MPKVWHLPMEEAEATLRPQASRIGFPDPRVTSLLR